MLRTLRVLALGRISPVAAEEREGALQALPANLRRGYGLIEIILGIALIAIFVVRIFQSYSQASSSEKVQDFQQMIGLISASVRAQSINAPDYSEVTNDTVAGSLPRKYLDQTASPVAIMSVYRVAVAIAPAASDPATFTIRTTVPRGDCEKIVLADMGRSVEDVNVGGTASNNERITQAQASTRCGMAGATGLNTPVTVIWTMR